MATAVLSQTPTLPLNGTADSLSATPAKPRLVFLDVIRGLAALCVLLQHTTEEVTHFSNKNWPFLFWSFRWFNLGRSGVAAFFLVSGFVIPYSLERASSLRTFWISRFFRLYPLFWFSILVVLAFHLLAPDSIKNEMMREYVPNWRLTLLVNITMLEEFVHFHHAIGLYWTLTLELVFYVLFSALFAVGQNKRSLLFAWLSLAAMLAAAAIDFLLHKKLPVSRIGLLSFAFLGTAAFRYFSSQITRRDLSLLAAAAAAVFFIAFALGFRSPVQTIDSMEGEWSWLSMFTSYAGGALLFALVFLFRGSEFPFPLRWLGTISYSVYLLHYPVWLALLSIPHHTLATALAWQFTVFSLTCLIASATYLLIEKPAIDLGKRLLHKPKPLTELSRPTTTMPPLGRVTAITTA